MTHTELNTRLTSIVDHYMDAAEPGAWTGEETDAELVVDMAAMVTLTAEQKEKKIVELFTELAEEDESGDFVRLMIRQLLSASISCPDDEFLEVQEIERQYVLDFPHLAKE